MLIVSWNASFIIIQNSRVFDNNGFQNMYSPYPSLIVTIYVITYLQIENKFHHRFSTNIMKFNDGWQKAKEN